MNNFDVLLGMKLGGGGGSSTLVEKTITANGTYNPADDNADGYSRVTANVPNTYALADEGKVVDSGALVSQTAKNIDANGLYDTTLNNSVNVAVPNSYTVVDEGKVVSSGTLVSQTATTCDSNGTIDTTLNNSVVVSVPNSYTAQDNGKVVVDQALVAQTAYPSTVTQNGTYDTTLNNSVTVDVPTGGGVTEKDVNFYDYDGTLVYSYTAQEFLALSELPANPTHTGLTAQGWNWTLADAKTEVTAEGALNVGQYYMTTDGATRLYCTFPNGYLSPCLHFYSSGATIDWGDNTTPDHVTRMVNTNHTYSTAGDYVITIMPDDINTKIGIQEHFINDNDIATPQTTASRNTVYRNCLNHVRFGKCYLDRNAFYNYTKLKTVSIPNDFNTTGVAGTFRECNSLQFMIYTHNASDTYNTYHFYKCGCQIVFNKAVTKIAAYSVASCKIGHLTSNITTVGNFGCQSSKLKYVKEHITTLGQSAFQYSSVQTVVLYSGLTTIVTSDFSGCASLTSITIPNTVTKIGDDAFSRCTSLASIEIPNSVTSIGAQAFSNCYLLNSVTIPSSVTIIGQRAFEYCLGLTNITIPSSVTTIGANAFNGCTGLQTITINAAEGSISGAPWGAPSSTQIVWTG